MNSKAGDRIVEKVLQGGESYFSHAVSIEGTLNYGYFYTGISERDRPMRLSV